MIDNLKPGLYIQHGNKYTALKSVSNLADLMLNGRASSLDALAAQVSWVFIALNKRRNRLLELTWEWQQDGEAMDGTPYDMPFKEMIQQVDESMQLNATAYFYKQRRGRQLVGIRWLDPNCVTPDMDTASHAKGGIQQYWYETNVGMQAVGRWLPKEDLIVFKRPGLRELLPSASAGLATRLAAEILRAMEQSTDSFYASGGLPITLVFVPPGRERERDENLVPRIRRLFNPRKRKTGEHRVAGVSTDVKIEQLSLAPKDMMQGETEKSKILAILAAHDVPESEVYEASNLATRREDIESIVLAVGGRLQYIADVMNMDDELRAAGYSLTVNLEAHPSQKRDNAEVALAYSRFYQNGMTAEAAAYYMGIKEEDFPEGMQVFEVAVLPESETAAEGGESDGTMIDEGVDEDDGLKAVELRKLRHFIRAGKHHKRPFHSDVLTPKEIQGEIARHELKAVQITPDGSNAPLPGLPTEYTPDDGDIDKAIAEWDELMPEFRQLGEADTVSDDGGIV